MCIPLRGYAMCAQFAKLAAAASILAVIKIAIK